MCSIAATSRPRRIVGAPGLPRGIAQALHERERRAAIVERHERQAHRRPRGQHAQGHLGDDAERAFGSDEQVDEVHARRREVAGRELRHIRHPVARHAQPDGVVGQDDFEVPVGIGDRFAAHDVEHLAAGQHHRQRPHPVARRAVLERRGARGVGGDDAAGEGAGEGRHRRIVAVRSREGGVEIDERHARPEADPNRRRCPGRDSDAPCSGRSRRWASRRRSATTARRLAAPPARTVSARRLRLPTRARRRRPRSRRESARRLRQTTRARRDRARSAARPPHRHAARARGSSVLACRYLLGTIRQCDRLEGMRIRLLSAWVLLGLFAILPAAAQGPGDRRPADLAGGLQEAHRGEKRRHRRHASGRGVCGRPHPGRAAAAARRGDDVARGVREDRREADRVEETGRHLLRLTGRVHERPCGAHAQGARREERPRARRRLEHVGERQGPGRDRQMACCARHIAHG